MTTTEALTEPQNGTPATDLMATVAQLRRRNALQPGVHELELLETLVSCSGQLRGADRAAEAAAFAEEAMTLARQVAPSMPSNKRDGLLALVLSDAGLTLAAADRPDEAVAALDEAVHRYRSSYDVLDPDAVTVLAGMLRALGEVSARQQRWDDALPAVAEAVELLAEVQNDDPDAVQPLLAATLYDLGRVLVEVGRPDDGREAVGEAVSTLEELAARHPGQHDEQLAVYRASHEGLPTPDEVLDVVREQAQSRRDEAAAEPGAHDAALARALFTLGAHAISRGRPEPALDAFTEAAQLFEPLAEADPRTHLTSLAASVCNVGLLLTARGEHAEALVAADRAVELYLTATGLDLPEPVAVENREFLAELQGVRAAILSALDRPEEAVPALEESAGLLLDLAATTDAGSYLTRYVATMAELSDRLGALGREAEAASVVERCDAALVQLSRGRDVRATEAVPQTG